jgi:2-polyprenyl-3-methyl-5-hydroxy-6-metoxy-1,4-benzoquinol methylase
MKHLSSILERLNNPKLSKFEASQRQAFHGFLADAHFGAKSRALSVSCGDGIWDYLVLNGDFGIASIDATDIVSCPVSLSDQKLLESKGDWHFHQVQADSPLPFDNDLFDLVFHQDVIEHTERPYSFMEEQYRVLRGGGVCIVGTPNFLRPMNCIKAVFGKLQFPASLGYTEGIGDYVHVQEFHSAQLKLLLEETGFVDVTLHHIYFGLLISGVCFSLFPTGSIGKTFAHFIMAKGIKK